MSGARGVCGAVVGLAGVIEIGALGTGLNLRPSPYRGAALPLSYEGIEAGPRNRTEISPIRLSGAFHKLGRHNGGWWWA